MQQCVREISEATTARATIVDIFNHIQSSGIKDLDTALKAVGGKSILFHGDGNIAYVSVTIGRYRVMARVTLDDMQFTLGDRVLNVETGTEYVV